jgi:hypothetical protein
MKRMSFVFGAAAVVVSAGTYWSSILTSGPSSLMKPQVSEGVSTTQKESGLSVVQAQQTISSPTQIESRADSSRSKVDTRGSLDVRLSQWANALSQGLSSDPKGLSHELTSLARSLNSEELQDLGLKASDLSEKLPIRYVSAFMLSRARNKASLSALETSLERLRLDTQAPVAHSPMPEGTVAIMLLDALAAHPDQEAALASLKRLERSSGLSPVHGYLGQLKHAVETGTMKEFRKLQNEKLQDLIVSND